MTARSKTIKPNSETPVSQSTFDYTKVMSSIALYVDDFESRLEIKNLTCDNYITEMFGNLHSSYDVTAVVEFPNEKINVHLSAWQAARAEDTSGYDGKEIKAAKGDSNQYLSRLRYGLFKSGNKEIAYLLTYWVDMIFKGSVISGSSGAVGYILSQLSRLYGINVTSYNVQRNPNAPILQFSDNAIRGVISATVERHTPILTLQRKSSDRRVTRTNPENQDW